MKKTISTIVQYVIFLGLGIWIIYHMLHTLTDQQKAELAEAIKNANVWYLIPVFIIGFLSHLFRAIRWRYLLETVDLKPSITNTTFAVLIGYVTNLAIPRGGEVAKCTILAKYEKAPADKMIGTIVAERAFDMVCLILVALLAFVLQAGFVSGFAADILGAVQQKLEEKKALLILVAIIGIAMVVLGVMLYRRHKETKVGRFVKELARGVFSIIHMKKRGPFLFYTVLIWGSYLMQLWVGFQCLPETTHLSVAAALVVLVYGSLGVIATPGGIGAYTALVTQMLVAYKIAEVPAQAFGWISWVAQTGVVVILGLVSLVAIAPYNKRRNGQATVDTA